MKTPVALAFELEAVLVECPVNILASMPDRFKTVIIHLNVIGVGNATCSFIKLNRSCVLIIPLFFLGIKQYRQKDF